MQLSAVPNHRHLATKTGPIARWYVYRLEQTIVHLRKLIIYSCVYRYLPVMALIGIGWSARNE